MTLVGWLWQAEGLAQVGENVAGGDALNHRLRPCVGVVWVFVMGSVPVSRRKRAPRKTAGLSTSVERDVSKAGSWIVANGWLARRRLKLQSVGSWQTLAWRAVSRNQRSSCRASARGCGGCSRAVPKPERLSMWLASALIADWDRGVAWNCASASAQVLPHNAAKRRWRMSVVTRSTAEVDQEPGESSVAPEKEQLEQLGKGLGVLWAARPCAVSFPRAGILGLSMAC